MTAVSIVVPFHNSEKYIGRCIESLLAQTYPREECEFLFVNNNSTDRSAEIVQGYPAVRLLAESKAGAYAARNCGLAAAQGELLALTDPDCVCTPGWLENMVRAMEPPEAGIVLGYRSYSSDSLLLSLVAAYEAEKARTVTSLQIKELYYGHTNNMAVRRSVFERVGLFPERMRGSDTIFVRRAVDAFGCDLVRYCPAMEVRHLEISDMQTYYQKRAIYGQSNALIGHLLAFRPLLNRERWLVFLHTIRAQRYSALKSVLLLGALVPGAVLYEWGRWRGQRKDGAGPA
jgi:glycosyltransferase involved in cell wall biosynthesis